MLKIEVMINATAEDDKLGMAEDDELVTAEEETVITATLGETGAGNGMHSSVVLPMLTAINLPPTNNSKR